MIIIIILINALLLLYFFIKNKDSIYFSLKTPLRFLLFIPLLAVIIFLCIMLTTLLEVIVLMLFADYYAIYDGVIYWDSITAKHIYYFIYYFLLVGIIEEGLKIMPMVIINSEAFMTDFKKKYDCIISFLIVGILFSVIEDVMYIYNY